MITVSATGIATICNPDVGAYKAIIVSLHVVSDFMSRLGRTISVAALGDGLCPRQIDVMLIELRRADLITDQEMLQYGGAFALVAPAIAEIGRERLQRQLLALAGYADPRLADAQQRSTVLGALGLRLALPDSLS